MSTEGTTEDASKEPVSGQHPAGGSERADTGQEDPEGESGDDQIAPAADQPKSQREILTEQIWTAVDQLERPTSGLLISGLSAGLDLGFSIFFAAVAFTAFGVGYEDPMLRLLAANLYAVGFVFVILGRSELFTEHTTLAVFPVLDGRASLSQLGRLWGLVYVSNIAGAIFAGFITSFIGPRLGSVDGGMLVEMAGHMLDHDSGVMLMSAMLAGWLMGLLSWLLSSAQETISRIVFVWIVTSMIGLGGLHHCIAGTVEVVAGVLSSPAVGWTDYLRFLTWSTLGNAVGGVLFVSILKYGHAVQERVPSPAPVPTVTK